MALVGDDCFFFLNSGCVRGSQCTFRHQPAARNTTVVCTQWLQRCCFKPNCLLRHTDDIVSRNQTPCYYEASSGVCWKPRCAFAHVRKPSIPLPLPPPPPVLPLQPPGLPAMPPVLSSLSCGLPVTVGITAVPPQAPLAVNLPLPNNAPVVTAEAKAVNKNPVKISSISILKQTVDNTLANPQPGLPSPPKLTELLLGTKLPPIAKEAVVNSVEPHIVSASVVQTPNVPCISSTAAAPKPITTASVAAAFPKSDHFNEQVRRFKEMLAAKNYDNSDDENGGSSYQVKERQRNRRDRREKEGYKTYKTSKSSKEKWSKAEEEILYGDYKDIPLDKKHKKKKPKDIKEYADSEPEVQVKSYENILREKALRKLYSRRKEKFNEDFKELVDENAAKKEKSDKTVRDNDGLPDKVLRKNKIYNSDGDGVDSSDHSEIDHKEYDKTYSKYADNHKSYDENEHEYYIKNSDLHDVILKKDIDSESRPRKRSKKHSKKKKHKSKKSEGDSKIDLIEIHSNGESQLEEKNIEMSEMKESKYSSDEGSDSVVGSETEGKAKYKEEEIIIPDETTNIDFDVDLKDDLAMEINQSEPSESYSKSKKMISSVVVPINSHSSDKSQHKKETTEQTDTSSSIKQSKRLNDKNKKNNLLCDSTPKIIQNDVKKVVRLVNRIEPPTPLKQAKPIGNQSIFLESVEKDIKVKSFDEIMAEKQKRNDKNIAIDNSDIVDIVSSVEAKTINVTLKEKSTRAKLEILKTSKDKSSSESTKVCTEDEKHKRKSIQLYKPPHPAKVDKTKALSTEVKMVVNTGPRKIIRIRKASLSTDLIDHNSPNENVEVVSSIDKNDSRETVNVRSFDEIIKEKRARQKREREQARQLEKENSTSEVSNVNTNNLIKRKPVIRRQAPIVVNDKFVSMCAVPKVSNNFSTVLSRTTTVNTISTCLDDSRLGQTQQFDSNVAKVPPLSAVPPKRTKSESIHTSGGTISAETLENKEMPSKLKHNVSRRSSTASSFDPCKDIERLQLRKHRKKSVTSIADNNLVLLHVPSKENKSENGDAETQSTIFNQTGLENHDTSRKDIQEALDENRRKREQDLLSDDEFEKEINELGSDDGDENFDDIDEDDLMMELEQMIDS